MTAQSGNIMDAVRMSDGEMIALKSVSRKTHPFEVNIATLLSSEPLRSHPCNHCVPVLEILDMPDQEGTTIIVMPLLRPFDNPSFVTVGESVEFFRQIFEVRGPMILCCFVLSFPH